VRQDLAVQLDGTDGQPADDRGELNHNSQADAQAEGNARSAFVPEGDSTPAPPPPPPNPSDYLEEALERSAMEEARLDQEESESDIDMDRAALRGEEDHSVTDADSNHANETADLSASSDAWSSASEGLPGSDGESDPDLPPRADGSEEDAEEQEESAVGSGAARAAARGVKKHEASLAKRRVTLIVNDEPGEETRIAVLRDGRLDSYFVEREATATNVGSIYKGRVMNVEAAIQAAFVDFGSGQNGFLHISDLHPKYFPSGGQTERVGKKIGRSERPLIQQALRKGQEILVQVIKEGLGSKGPTVTSYLSIPGRLLVMMPDMDRVGVSRRVDDEDQRRDMRRILDSLELPNGFGFILRTAGFDASRTGLQRDAAYLKRLWDAMEARSARTGAPCELYTESDVLVRTLRDQIDATVESIVVDSAGSFERAKTFLDVIAPQLADKVKYYNGMVPVFDAYGIERQIDEIHSRIVPLPSGGALVFDQTEALVAIDVNSGRSRAARDSETNAFLTNCEAVEEVCRQLRLRDLGGLIVIDSIDMRQTRHRREIEDRLAALLKLDQAKTSFAPISEFGMIEMTRQRMRPSLRKMNYADCPNCGGSGEIRVPGAVAADAMRRLALLFSYDSIRRVELVCSVRVAAELLSNRRRAMHELEDRFSKRIDVRISEVFAADRLDMYAYAADGADIELDRLPEPAGPNASTLHSDLPEADEEDLTPTESLSRKRRRKRRPAPADATAIAMAGGFDDLPPVVANEGSLRSSITRSAAASARQDADEQDEAGDAGGRRRGGRRNRRGRGGEREGSEGSGTPQAQQPNAAQQDQSQQNSRRDGGGRRRGRGGRSVRSLTDMARENAAFETTRVAEVAGASVDDLLARLRSAVDADTAALIRPTTSLLPPELVRIAAELFEAPGSGDAASNEAESAPSADAGVDATTTGGGDDAGDRQSRRRRRGRGRGRGGRGRGGGAEREQASPQSARATSEGSTSAESVSAPVPTPIARPEPPPVQPQATPPAEQPPAKPKRRSLYGAAVRLLSSIERSKAKGRSE
jgi:ribonuclease E